MPVTKSHRFRIQIAAACAALIGIVVGGCVARPLPPRASVNDLIAQSLATSSSEMDVNEIAPDQIAGEFTVLDDGTLFYEVISDLTAASDPRAAVNKLARDAVIDEEFIEQDIREALLIVAENAEVDIILDTQITGIVNTQLKELSLGQALDKILMPLGFVYGCYNDQVLVCPADPESKLFRFVATRQNYQPKNLDAKALGDTLPTRLKQFSQVIEESNLIVIDAPHRISAEIVERLAEVDQPIPQVVLEAIICVIEPDSGFQFGLDWQHAVELNEENAFKLGATGLALSSNYSPAGASALFSEFSKTSTFVKLLSENGYLTIRATPHVMARDGEQANISINRQTYFSVQPSGAGTSENNAFFLQQDVQTVESGITLDITPHVRGDMVTIEIEKAEVSEDVRNANTELALNPYPIINRRTVSTTVNVKDGKTIVIGGLVQRQTIDRVNRIPGLSNLPLMGYLFETVQRQTRDAEVVIFISPRIVKPPTITEELEAAVFN